MDSEEFEACTSPREYTGLSDGTHTFAVRATDLAGNTDETPASYDWTVDTTAPDTTITDAPVDPSNSAAGSFSFESTESSSTFACKMDEGEFGACTSPYEFSGLADGSHTFQVQAADALGNTDLTPATYGWTIDTVEPETTITDMPSNPSGSVSGSFSFNSDDPAAHFECSLDAAAFTACVSPHAYGGLASGVHSFAVRAIDVAGNTDSTPASYDWTIDVIAPETTITGAPAELSGDPNPAFSFESDDPAAGFECRLDDGGFESCESPLAYEGLADGPYSFEVRAIDGLGNTDETPASHAWTIDTDAPETNFDTPSDPSSSRNISFSFGSDDPDATFECELDESGFDVCASPKSYLDLAYGSHFFQVRAVDGAGNPDPTPSSFSWTVNRLLFLPFVAK